MKKLGLLSLTALLFASCTSGIKPSDFEDIEFAKYCFEQFDLNHDSILSEEEAMLVTEISVLEMDIKSLKGIEYFPNLVSLDCRGTSVSSLDLSKNTQLKYLDCGCTALSSLDLSKNTQLKMLDCTMTGLSKSTVYLPRTERPAEIWGL